MKKHWVKVGGIIILAVVLMVIVGLVSFRTVVPTGVLIAPLGGLVAVAVTIGVGTVPGVLTVVVAGIILHFLQNADWLLVLNFLLLTLFIGWLIGWRLPRGQRVTHQQLIWLGIVSGITEFLITVCLTALFGWQTGGSWLVSVRLNLLSTVLTVLCDAVFIGPLAFIFRWLADQLLPPEEDGSNDHHGAIEIDLSEKKKNQK